MYKRGISLISLVITIIVMIILAGISMNAIFGENGIINQAMKSKDRTEEAAAKEMIELAWSARMTKFYEDLSAGKVSYSDMEAYFTSDEAIADLNALLGSGTIKGNIMTTGNGYKLLYVDSNGNSYVMDMTKAGAAEVNERVTFDEEIITDEMANVTLEEYIDKSNRTDTDRVGLYGTKITTGVTSIVGDEGETSLDDNWKVFYIDSNYVYLIYGDFYPNKALINLDENVTHGQDIFDADYEVYVVQQESYNEELNSDPGREILLNYLNDTSNWSNIVTSLTATGKTFGGLTNLKAYGGPTLEMWVSSYNEKWNETLGYKRVGKGNSFNFYSPQLIARSSEVAPADGYVVTMHNDESPTYYSWYYYETRDSSDGDGMDLKEGFLDGGGTIDSPNYVDNLYYPRKGSIYATHGGFGIYVLGYWLRTPAAQKNDYVLAVLKNGNIRWRYVLEINSDSSSYC